jgi:glycerol-3-phosphate acyltransferase PlsY
MLYIFSILLGYLFGAIPTSYLLVKFFTGRILYEEGSKNVGAMNSYEITRNKLLGIACAFADGVKGIIAIVLAYIVFEKEVYLSGALFGAVLGHNYSVFIKFRGGRGLSTAAFGLILINPIGVIFWLIIFFISKSFISKNVHINNTISTIFTVIFVVALPENLYYIMQSLFNMNYQNYIYLLISMCILILAKHIEPLKEISRN